MKALNLTIIGLIVSLFSFTATAQESKKHTILSGRVIEETSKTPIEYATIRVYNKTDEMVDGIISDANGEFEVAISVESFYVVIDFIGFESTRISEFPSNNNIINLGDIKLTMSAQNLQEFEVRGEKSSIEFKTDKRIFNVGKDLVSTGGSALDVLNNVPSVNVNIEGEVSLRGNANVLILINGKPSVITEGNALGTITADMLEKVEVITNPSAKYDAEGTSGILNLIIKKEDKKGTNGAISLNTGFPHNHSVGISLNRRTENFNIFSQIGVGYRKFNSSANSITINKDVEQPVSLHADGIGEKNELFYNLILGTDYHINEFNIMTLSGHLGYEIEDEYALLNYQSFSNVEELLSSSNREEITEGINPKMEFRFNYEKTFEADEKQKLSVNATGSYFGKDKTSNYTNTVLSEIGEVEQQIAATDFAEKSYDISADYIHPFRENSTLEVGAKYTLESMLNDYAFSRMQENQWVIDENYTNDFEYHKGIIAAYSTFEQKIENFGVKGGLRFEHTTVNTLLHNTNKDNSRSYFNFFPTLHTTLEIAEGASIQAGYSRRISRPGMWDVNPFFSMRDEYNLHTGNPDILPEYTHAFEATAVKIHKNTSISLSVFHRRTSDVISDILDIENNVTISTIANIGSSYNTGLELNAKTEPVSWLSLMVDCYYSYYQREGIFEEQDFSFSSNVYSGRVTTKLKLPASYDVEIKFRHRSGYKDIQSTMLSQSMIDLGIRKKILKGRGVINLSVNDIFSSHRRTELTDLDSLYRYSQRQRDGRRFIIGFSWGFGKGEAMEFSGQKMF